MIHRTVAGGTSFRGRRPWRGRAKVVSGVCACLLVVVGAVQVAAQSNFLPPAQPVQAGDSKPGATHPDPPAVPMLPQPRTMTPYGNLRLPRMPLSEA